MVMTTYIAKLWCKLSVGVWQALLGCIRKSAETNIFFRLSEGYLSNSIPNNPTMHVLPKTIIEPCGMQ